MQWTRTRETERQREHIHTHTHTHTHIRDRHAFSVRANSSCEWIKAIHGTRYGRRFDPLTATPAVYPSPDPFSRFVRRPNERESRISNGNVHRRKLAATSAEPTERDNSSLHARFFLHFDFRCLLTPWLRQTLIRAARRARRIKVQSRDLHCGSTIFLGRVRSSENTLKRSKHRTALSNHQWLFIYSYYFVN